MGVAQVRFGEVDTMHDFEEASLVLGLGFLADRTWDILDGGDLLNETDPSRVLDTTADRLEWLYLTEASELAFKRSDYLSLRISGLKDEIQKAAHEEARMASEMVEGVCATLRAVSRNEEVTERQVKNAKQFLEFISKGTLAHVQRLRVH
jgi:hypothetical protein